MGKAIELAKNGLYTTDPNPRVGCVIVNDGQIVGSGWHQFSGQPHAEPIALADAGASAKGATAYVTLEPCSHFGKTPPCCEALIKAGVSRVVAAMVDPNPEVSGSGLNKLRDAGIDVITDIMANDSAELNPGFIKRMKTGLPFVRCKMAMSLDGRTAMESGESQWITGPDARAEVHKLRARSSIVVTGVESVLIDNPSLTVRPEEFELESEPSLGKVQPMKAIVDSNLKTPLSSKIFKNEAKVIIFTAVDLDSDSKSKYGSESRSEMDMTQNYHINQLQSVATIVSIPDKNRRVDLKAMIRHLGEIGCNEVLIESGATLAGAMVQDNLIDEILIFMAPKLLGSKARPLFNLPFDKMSDQVGVEISHIEAIGIDWLITLKPSRV